MSGWTERELLDLLWARHAVPLEQQLPPRYVLAEHVRYEPASAQRIADALAIDTWRSGRYALEGYEAKVTRSDFRRELADPSKAETWARHCRRWTILAPAGVVPRDELPRGWGLLEATTSGTLRMAIPPGVRTETEPLRPAQIAALARACSQTAAHHARRRA